MPRLCGGTMTTDNLPYHSIPVDHFSTDRLAGLQFLLRYAPRHQHARNWIVPLTLLIQKGGNVDG
jgi:hypothetical protein